MNAAWRAAGTVGSTVLMAALLVGCDDSDRSDPFIYVDTRDNSQIIDAPIKGKSSNTKDYMEINDYVFRFKVVKGNETHTSAVIVSKETYNRFDVGDRVRLRCEAASPCVVDE